MEFLAARFGRQQLIILMINCLQVLSKVLCHPICSEDEELEAVIEFIKEGKGSAFTEDDIEVRTLLNDCYSISYFLIYL